MLESFNCEEFDKIQRSSILGELIALASKSLLHNELRPSIHCRSLSISLGNR